MSLYFFFFPDGDAEMSGAAAGPRMSRGQEESQEVGASNYDRLMSVAHFSVKAVCSTHMRIARMSRRVFLLSAKLGAHVQTVISQLNELLAQIDSTSVASLQRKLHRIVEDFQLSERIVHELMHGSGRRGKFDSPCHTPVDSPYSTPRCNSPVTAVIADIHSEAGPYLTPEKLTPLSSVPQNNKRKLKRAIPRRSYRETSHPSSPSSGTPTEKVHQDQFTYHEASYRAAGDAVNTVCLRLGSSSPPNRRKSNLPLRRKTIEGDTVAKRGGSSSPTIRRRTHDGCVISSSQSTPASRTPVHSPATSTPVQALAPVVPLISVTDTSDPGTGPFNPVLLSDLDENYKETNEEASGDNDLSLFESLKATPSPHPNDHVSFCVSEKPQTQSPSPSSCASKSVKQSSCCCQCQCHNSGITEETVSSPASCTTGDPNTPESASNNHYHTAEQESMSSDDFLDFSQEAATSTNEKPVSFKSEVAESPKSSPSHSVHSGKC